MHIRQRHIMNQFNTIPAKQVLSGTVLSDSASIKIIFIMDRNNLSLLATCVANANGNWEIACPLREDEKLMAICRDEGEEFNADIYDRVSLCTDNYAPSLSHDNLVIGV